MPARLNIPSVHLCLSTLMGREESDGPTGRTSDGVEARL